MTGLVPPHRIRHHVRMLRYLYLALILIVLGGAGCMAYASHQTQTTAPQMTIDPAHQVLLAYADAITRFDQDGIFTTVCPDSAPEAIIQTFLAIGEEGRISTANALRAATFESQFSTDIKKVFSLQLQTPQGAKTYPIQVIQLDGKWCVDETGT